MGPGLEPRCPLASSLGVPEGQSGSPVWSVPQDVRSDSCVHVTAMLGAKLGDTVWMVY